LLRLSGTPFQRLFAGMAAAIAAGVILAVVGSSSYFNWSRRFDKGKIPRRHTEQHWSGRPQ